jgi:transcriptional regulator with XRE-family HTH domain
MRPTKHQKRRLGRNQSLAEVRKKAGLTQEDMAARLNLTQATISRIESRKLAIKLSMVREIADAYGVPVESLLPEAA